MPPSACGREDCAPVGRQSLGYEARVTDLEHTAIRPRSVSIEDRSRSRAVRPGSARMLINES